MFEACNYYERYLVNRQKETEERSKSVSFVKSVDVVNKKLDTPNNPNDNLEKHQDNHSNTENTVKEESQPYNANYNDLNFVDFSDYTISYAYTKPVYLEYFGERHETDSWSGMYDCVLACLLDDYPDKIFALSKNSMQNDGKMWLGDIRHQSQMSQPRKFAKGMFAEVNLSATDIVRRVRQLLDYCLVDAENLIVAYRHIQTGQTGTGKNAKGNITIRKNTRTISQETGNGVALAKAEEYLQKVGLTGATINEIIDNVQPDAAVYPTKNTLKDSSSVITMPFDRYVHSEAFVDLEEAKEKMSQILQTHFTQFFGYSNSKLLFGAASHELSMFLNENDCEDIDKVYSLAQFFFGRSNAKEGYSFSNPHIFEKTPDFPLTSKGLMINLARMNNDMLYENNAKEFLQKTMLTDVNISQLLQLSSSDTFLCYNEKYFLLTENLGIDSVFQKTIHDKLDTLFRQEDVAYIIPRDINKLWLNSLPQLPQELPWTLLFLQEVLKKYPNIGFRLIAPEHAQSYHTIVAAIVPAGSPLQSFPDVVTLYMQEKYTLPMQMAREELRQALCDAGMLKDNELYFVLHKALDDYRFVWSDDDQAVLIRGN